MKGQEAYVGLCQRARTLRLLFVLLRVGGITSARVGVKPRRAGLPAASCAACSACSCLIGADGGVSVTANVQVEQEQIRLTPR